MAESARAESHHNAVFSCQEENLAQGSRRIKTDVISREIAKGAVDGQVVVAGCRTKASRIRTESPRKIKPGHPKNKDGVSKAISRLQ